MSVLDKIRGSGLIGKGDRIAAAVSGGRDSMALLGALLLLRTELSLDLSCVHVVHGLRENGEADADAVEAFCREREIPFFRYRADVPGLLAEESLSVEAAARRLRYRIFDEHLGRGFCDKIAIAHTEEDFAETVLFHLIRGTGTGGLCAMRPSVARPRGEWIRPLFQVSRSEVAVFCSGHGLPVREDETNRDRTYSRNRLRLDAFPALEAAHPGATANLLAFARRMAGLDAFLEESARPYVGQDHIRADIPRPLLPYALRLVLGRGEGTEGLTERHISAAEKLLADGVPGDRISLPHRRVLLLEREKDGTSERRLRIAEESDFVRKPDGFYSESLPFRAGTLNLAELTICVGEEKSAGALAANAGAIPQDAVFRFPRAGDRIRPFGMKGTKSLGDFFTDRKISADTRRKTPVLASGNRILAVLPAAISEELRIREGDTRIWIAVRKEDEVPFPNHRESRKGGGNRR